MVLGQLHLSDDVSRFLQSGEALLLNIGGTGDVDSSTDGLKWINVNAQNKSGNTDVIRLMDDLKPE